MQEVVARVTTEAQLRAALMDQTITRVELHNTILLSDEVWPSPPFPVKRNVTVTSPEELKSAQPAIFLNGLSNKLRLEPRVVLTFTRVFVTGIRNELVTAAPGFNLLAASVPALPQDWPQIRLANATLVLIKCPPIPVILSKQFIDGMNGARNGRSLVLACKSCQPH